MLKKVLDYFEGLKKQAKNSDFNNYLDIQNSIIKAQHKTKDYYVKTNAFIIWVATLVLYPRFKFKYFNNNQKNTPRFISTARTKLKKLQIDKYRPKLGQVA